MKDLERCFGISLAWGHQRIESGDYVLIHTRSHDMAADIYTKGFQNRPLFWRLRQLINIYTVAEIDNWELNPAILGDDAQPVENQKSDDLNSQYKIIISGANSKTKIKKAIKVKAKAKAKAKPMLNEQLVKKKPDAVVQAMVADSTGVDLNDVKWFMRVDFGATQYVGANEDPRCPEWPTVRWRRTYNIRNGKIILLDHILHDAVGRTDANAGVKHVNVNGEMYRECRRHHELIDGGLSRDIATFLYSSESVSMDDISKEKRMLSYLSPKGSRLYSNYGNDVRHTIIIFDDVNDGDKVHNTSVPIRDAWLNGFAGCRVFQMYNPINLDFDALVTLLGTLSNGILWLVYPWANSNSSILPSVHAHDNNKVWGRTTSDLQCLSNFHDQLSRRCTNEVHFLLEITCAVGLKDAPPVFPKGFRSSLNSFGGLRVSHHMALPFLGQHSLFVTSSSSLGQKVNSFVQESNAYQISSSYSNEDVPGNWVNAVRDFNITCLMCCLTSVEPVHKTFSCIASSLVTCDYSICTFRTLMARHSCGSEDNGHMDEDVQEIYDRVVRDVVAPADGIADMEVDSDNVATVQQDAQNLVDWGMRQSLPGFTVSAGPV